MNTSEFPSNSKNPKQPGNEPKKIERVVTDEVIMKKKSLGLRFKEMFIGGDSRTVMQYVIMDVLIPHAKEMLSEAATQGFERLIYGEPRSGSRRYGSRGNSAPNYTNYNRYSSRGNNPIGRATDRDDRSVQYAQMRSSHDKRPIFQFRHNAEAVLDQMSAVIEKYESVSVQDFNSMIGEPSRYTDGDWGWTTLRNANIQKVRDGWVLNLPEVEELD